MARFKACLFLCLSFGVFWVCRMQARASLYERIGAAMADNNFYMPALSFLNIAALTNPWQMHHVEREINALFSYSQLIDNGDFKKVAAIAMWSADWTVKIHPNDCFAHSMRAMAFKTVSLGFKKDTILESRKEMDKALELFPTYKPFLSDAVEIARSMNDEAEVKRRQGQIDHLNALEAYMVKPLKERLSQAN